MGKGAIIACAIWVLCFMASGTARGDDQAASPSAIQTASNAQPDKELFLFFEEQDLVTATRRSTPLRTAPAIATIITADEIRKMGARNLRDVLLTVPGLGISINEFGGHMLEVRGIRSSLSEKILVMIDGHSLNNNFTGSALFRLAGTLPMEYIRQIEVVRGPGSALYGNSAFLATINIITRDAEEIDGFEVKGGAGSFDSYKGSLVGGKAFGEKLTLSGSLDHYRTEGARLAVDADTLAGTPFSRAPGTTDLRFRQTDAFLKVGYGDLSFRGHFNANRDGMNIGIASALTDESSQSDAENYWGELACPLRLSDSLTATLKLSFDHYQQDPNMKIYPDGFAGAYPDGMVGKPMVKDRTIGSQLQTDWEPFSGNHLIAGVSFEEMRQYDVRQLGNFDPLTGAPLGSMQEVANWNQDVTRRIVATYLQDEWQLPGRVNLTVGVRYDHYSDFGETINPRAGLVWSFFENADLKLLYGQAFRAPNFQELYNINNPVVVGNPGLKPERIKTFEGGLAWRFNRFIAGGLNYFNSTINDQIGWDTATSPAVNANIGRSKTQGVELTANGAYEADISWKCTVTYQDPKDAVTGRRLPYVPSQRATGSVNYGLTKYVNLHGDVLWTGTRPRGPGDSRDGMPAYATVDLAVMLKNFHETLEVQATVRNLFDERYKDPDTSGGAVNLAGTGPKVPGDFPREGISAFVTASYGF